MQDKNIKEYNESAGVVVTVYFKDELNNKRELYGKLTDSDKFKSYYKIITFNGITKNLRTYHIPIANIIYIEEH